MINSLNDLTEHIINKINPDWTTLEKIRYIYIEVGKHVCKNTDFFEAMRSQEKLKALNYSEEKLFEIYNEQKLENNSKEWNKVICKSAAEILQIVLNKAGIKSKLISTINSMQEEDSDSIEINHWFLCVFDNDKKYFLTLAADLPYIQNGMQTQHFATHIQYKKLDKNGIEKQVYSGDEIKETCLTDSELEEIDKKIGYLNTYYKNKLVYYDEFFEILRKECLKNAYYYKEVESKTIFYQEFIKVLSKSCNLELSKLNEKNSIVVINKILELIKNKVLADLNIDAELKYNDIFEWKTELFKLLKQNAKYENINNLQTLIHKASAFIDKIILFSKLENRTKEDYKNFSKTIDIFLNLISFYFLDEDKIYVKENGSYVGINFIENKFYTTLTKILNCNETLDLTDENGNSYKKYNTTDFNNLEYSEQIVIIKKLISLIFFDLKKEECIYKDIKNSEITPYNEKYSPIFNRIEIFPIKNKNNNKYNIVFHIKKLRSTEIESFYLFNNENNTLEKIDRLSILSLKNDYIILSDRFSKQLKELDQIEDIETKKK